LPYINISNFLRKVIDLGGSPSASRPDHKAFRKKAGECPAPEFSRERASLATGLVALSGFLPTLTWTVLAALATLAAALTRAVLATLAGMILTTLAATLRGLAILLIAILIVCHCHLSKGPGWKRSRLDKSMISKPFLFRHRPGLVG
jgi:hypothetical protein